MNIESSIEHFIREELAYGSRARIDPDHSLLESGILDSLGLLRLVMYLEETYQIKVDDGEVMPANFETINAIKSFVSEKGKLGQRDQM
jgi:acyl carrier protein